MGRFVSGAARWNAGASVVYLCAGVAQAQVPSQAGPPTAAPPAAVDALPPQAPRLPAPEPIAPVPSLQPAPRPSGSPPPPALPPLEPPAHQEPPKRPAFLHTGEEMERIQPARSGHARARSSDPAPATKPLPGHLVRRASPWVDFSITSFFMENRAGNFLNLGAQFGGYFFDRLRLSGRLVAPLEDVNDDLARSSSGTQDSSSFRRVRARSISLLYGVSAGLLITNSRSFVFGPGVGLMRTDVGAYGTTLLFALPFEWTTQRNWRIGFEIALGYALGGSVRENCETFSSPSTVCPPRTTERPDGTAVLLQYNMGWAFGHL